MAMNVVKEVIRSSAGISDRTSYSLYMLAGKGDRRKWKSCSTARVVTHLIMPKLGYLLNFPLGEIQTSPD